MNFADGARVERLDLLAGWTAMNKLTAVWLVALVLMVGVPGAARAHSRFHTHFGFYFGYPSYYWRPYYYPYYYPYYRSYYYYSPPPTVYVEPPQPKVYVQQPAASYWYYCPAAEKYYPYVQSCPQGWLQVVPQSSPPP